MKNLSITGTIHLVGHVPVRLGHLLVPVLVLAGHLRLVADSSDSVVVDQGWTKEIATVE
jgi:hypothetical protein